MSDFVKNSIYFTYKDDGGKINFIDWYTGDPLDLTKPSVALIADNDIEGSAFIRFDNGTGSDNIAYLPLTKSEAMDYAKPLSPLRQNRDEFLAKIAASYLLSTKIHSKSVPLKVLPATDGQYRAEISFEVDGYHCVLPYHSFSYGDDPKSAMASYANMRNSELDVCNNRLAKQDASLQKQIIEDYANGKKSTNGFLAFVDTSDYRGKWFILDVEHLQMLPPQPDFFSKEAAIQQAVEVLKSNLGALSIEDSSEQPLQVSEVSDAEKRNLIQIIKSLLAPMLQDKKITDTTDYLNDHPSGAVLTPFGKEFVAGTDIRAAFIEYDYGKDLFNVSLIAQDPIAYNVKTIKRVSDVYGDMLVEVIGELVEDRRHKLDSLQECSDSEPFV